MVARFTRRKFVGTAGAAAAAGLTLAAPFRRKVLGATPLTVVEWGPPYVDSMKKVAGKQSRMDITWVLHQGGSAAILPKVQAAWPNPPYDLIAAWKPVFLTMNREEWLEPITVERVPNMKNIPEDLITKDANGNWLDIPRSLSGAFFGYRPDICPIEITKLDDLLDPRLKGQIMWPNPINSTNLHVVALALANGGDEYNLEPGWMFLKELAKSGNIGGVYGAISQVINALTTGQYSVTFTDLVSFQKAAQNVPIKLLTKTDESLKSFPWSESWGVLNRAKHKEEAFWFANFTISPQNNTLFNEGVRLSVTNKEAPAVEGLEEFAFTTEELKTYAHFADFDHLSKTLDAAVKRFEKEIIPLL